MVDRTEQSFTSQGPQPRQRREDRKDDQLRSWLGLVDYQTALIHQQSLARDVAGELRSDEILGLEHPFIITLGRRAKEVPTGPVVRVERGGEATLHSPGQLVVYPIVKIRGRIQVREWVELLQQVTARTLGGLGLETVAGPHAGLWTAKGKIASMGLRISEGVSTHGLALNVSNDLSLFQQISPCGMSRGAAMDSLASQDISIGTEALFRLWCDEFARSFKAFLSGV